jgi:colicin import membrane protein
MSIVKVSIPKAGIELEFDTDALDEGVYQEAMWLGLTGMARRGQEKFTKTLYSNPDELKAAAAAKAQEIYAQLQAGEFRSGRRASKSELSGSEKTESMRLARNYTKDAIKAAGRKIGHYEARDITAMAKALLEDPDNGPAIIEEAKANLSKQKAVKISINTDAIPVSEKKVAAADAKKAADKAKREAAKAAKEAAGGGKPPAKVSLKGLPKAHTIPQAGPKGQRPTAH